MRLLKDVDLAKKLGADAGEYCARELSSVSMVRKYERVFGAVVARDMPQIDTERSRG